MPAEEEVDGLNREELLSTMPLILVAGNETTRNLIRNSMLALLRYPQELLRLREAPGLLHPAVDELLHYDNPGQLERRVIREDLEMGGKRLRADQKVIDLLGAANRDPAAFENTDALDIGRNETSHLSFGRGIHYCLGASLVMLEAHITFRGLLDRFPSIRLAAEPSTETVSSFAAWRAYGSRWSKRGSPPKPDAVQPGTRRSRNAGAPCFNYVATAPPNPHRRRANIRVNR